MNANMNSASEANVVSNENSEATNATTQETSNDNGAPNTKGAKKSRKSRKGAKGAAREKNATSKIRKRAFSTIAVKSKRHVLVVVDKKGAETFATGRNELSRAAKINAVMLSAGRPLTLSQIREKLDSLYGANHVKALSNHMRALLVKGAATLKDGAYALKTKKAPAPVADKGAETGASEAQS